MEIVDGVLWHYVLLLILAPLTTVRTLHELPGAFCSLSARRGSKPAPERLLQKYWRWPPRGRCQHILPSSTPQPAIFDDPAVAWRTGAKPPAQIGGAGTAGCVKEIQLMGV